MGLKVSVAAVVSLRGRWQRPQITVTLFCKSSLGVQLRLVGKNRNLSTTKFCVLAGPQGPQWGNNQDFGRKFYFGFKCPILCL